MKINIVNYEQGMGIDGILTKYAKQMAKALIDLGYTATISDMPAKKADINHHINYLSYQKSQTVDTLMVTHITSDKRQTNEDKIERLKKALKTSFGICFSKGMVDKLIKAGLPKDKLDFVLPAHDSLPRRPRLIAIVTKLYPDGRKREEMFKKMFLSLKDPKKYIFRIMGDGWEPLLRELEPKGIQVQWGPGFDLNTYTQLLNTSEFLLYTGGEDALAQSIIDATQAGLRVIAPPQEDIEVDKPFTTQEELNKIFSDMVVNPVEDWTWENYVKKHLEIWKTLLKKPSSRA